MRAHLMLALYRSGRQIEALDAYRAARRALVDELGIEPSPGLADLERAILRHDPALAASSATTPAPPARAPIARHAATATTAAPRPAGPRTPAIVGRGPVITRIDEALDASASSGAVLRIVGDAGMGKTRLVQEAAERARARGRLVLEGRATPTDAASALGVFCDLVRADRRARPDADLPADPLAASFPSWLLPELATPPGESELDRGVLFEAASRYFRALAGPASHALIHYLARTSASDPVLLLLTYRPQETPEDTSLSQLVHELVRDRLGDEVVLQPLDEPAVGALVAALADCAPDAEALATIATMSGGNPFAGEEIVRAALEEGHLDPASGRLRTGGRLPLPQTVQDMLVARVRRLSPGDRELLRWACVAGESFDVRLLIAVSGGSEDEVLAGLDRLSAAGLMADEGVVVTAAWPFASPGSGTRRSGSSPPPSSGGGTRVCWRRPRASMPAPRTSPSRSWRDTRWPPATASGPFTTRSRPPGVASSWAVTARRGSISRERTISGSGPMASRRARSCSSPTGASWFG
jgi:hypothetical protein